jgi:hypothetical protein
MIFIRRGLFLVLLSIALISRAQNLRPVKDNLACLWGFKNDKGQWVIQPRYTDLELGYDTIIPALFNGKWGIINRQGKVLISFQYDRVTPQRPDYYRQGEEPKPSIGVYVEKGKLTGLVDYKEKVLIPIEYDALWPMPNDSCFYIVKNKKTGIRTFNRIVVPCVYGYFKKADYGDLFMVGSEGGSDANGMVYAGKNFGIIKLNGDTVIPCRYDFLKLPDRYTIGNRYESEQRYLNTLIVAGMSNGRVALYDYSGKCLLEPVFNFIDPIELDAFGAYAYSSSYRRVSDYVFARGQSLLFLDQTKMGFVTVGKGIVQPAQFDSVYHHQGYNKRNELLRVRRDGKWGLLNMDGSTLLPCDYQQIMIYANTIMVKDNKKGYREWDFRTKTFRKQNYEHVIRLNNFLILTKGKNYYTNAEDTMIRLCKNVRELDEDIIILNRGVILQGKGKNAKPAKLNGIKAGNAYYYAVQTDKGKLLCDQEFKVLVKAGVYFGFGDVDYSNNLVVITQSGKTGLMDISGKLVLDTVYEAIGSSEIQGMLMVKPLPQKGEEASGRCMYGWALVDSKGTRLTEPILVTNALKGYAERQFILTLRGLGVFDLLTRKFVVAPAYRNGFFTGDGGCIMQNQDHRFIPFNFKGEAMTAKGWTHLLNVGGSNNISRDDADYSIRNDSAVQTTDRYGDAWILMEKDSMVLFSNGELIRDKKLILGNLFRSFGLANTLDIYSSNSWMGYRENRHVNLACPRLSASILGGTEEYYYEYVVLGMPSQKKDTNLQTLKDSLVERIVRRLAPTSLYPLEPNSRIECGCVAKDYNQDWIEPEEDPRGIRDFAESSYYRVVYGDTACISLQIVDDYHYSDFGSSINRDLYRDSRFENYQVNKSGWKEIKLDDLFSKGYEALLQRELVLSIQKADSLEMDCSRPGSQLEQCEGRFSLNDKCLILYMEDHSGYEFFALFVPWTRLKSIIPPNSPAYKWVSKK